MKKSKLLKLVGKRIKEVRESKNITQLQLVINMEEVAGKFDTTNVSRIESGRTNPTIYTLHRIAEALEVELTELIDF
ncbi:helix-turn-helix transcriptional regulator [Flaviramulus aquimarinus]